MRPLTKEVRLPKEKYYEKHLAIINPLLPVSITPREIEVLAHFMSLEGDIAQDRFGPSARKLVKAHLGLSDGGLGNFLKALKTKGFIRINAENKIEVNPLLNVDAKEQVYSFKLININTIDNDTIANS